MARNPSPARGSRRKPAAAPPPAGRQRPTRRALAAALVTAALVLGALWWVRRPQPPLIVKTGDQNVLLITIDTLRADTLSLYGGRAASPNLTALAGAGFRFDFAHAHAVVTLPSHASILTGLFPFQHGIRDNSGYRVTPGTRTLATLLEARGYATGAFVGAFPLDSRFGLDTGFDVYDDRFGESRATLEFSFAERPAGDVVAAAREWLARQQGKWFAWVHLFDPHSPYRPPAPFAAQYAGAPYDGEAAYVDAALGPLLGDVTRGGSRKTLVVVTSDHGEGLGDHGEQTHGLLAYETTLKVPLIVAQVPQGARVTGQASTVPVSHVDLVPTVLDALGIEIPGGLEGRSLLEVFTGHTGALERRASYFEAMSASLNRGWAPLRGVLAGREKLIDVPIVELYDLEADPGEQTNLAAREPGRLRALAARLSQFGATGPGDRVAENPEVVARLRALGYVSGSPERKTRYSEDDDPKRLIALDGEIQQGIAFVQAGRLAEARDVYRAVLAKRPDMALAYRHLAFVLWELGQPREAIEVLKDAMQSGASIESVRTQLATYLAETGSAGDALAIIGPEAERSTDAETVNALGIAYARAGDRDAAFATFRRVLTLDTRNAMAWQNIGTLHLEAGEFHDAEEAFRRALEVDPRLAAAYTGLGVAHEKTGNRGAAIDNWWRAVELDPSEFNALYNLATNLVRDGRVSEAIPHLERFVRTAPPGLYASDIRELQALLVQLQQDRVVK